VRRRAQEEGWRTREVTCRGGARLAIALEDLPEDVQPRLARQLGNIGEEFDLSQLPLDTLPADQRDLVAGRIMAVRAWERHLSVSPKSKRAATSDFVDEYNPRSTVGAVSWASLNRWAKAFRESGPTGLVDGRATRSEEIPESVWSAFVGAYLDPRKPSVLECYRLAVAFAHEKGERIPSARTFRRRVKSELPRDAVVLAREGVETFRNTVSPYISRDYFDPSLLANVCWVGDHHTFDLFCVHPQTGRPFRPWLTGWMDFRSRKMVGWLVCASPNSETILAAFRHGALRYGLPEQAYIDNGKDYRSKTFAGGRKRAGAEDEEKIQSTLERFDIQPRFATPYNPKPKHIERLFGHVADRFARKWPTYCGGKPENRPEGLDKKVAALHERGELPTLQEVAELWSEWVEADYNQRPSSAAGMKLGGRRRSPAYVFDALCERRRVADPAAMRLLMMRASNPRTVDRGRIKLFGFEYFADELLQWPRERVYVRYDREQIGRVAVFTLDDERFLCWAENVELVSALAGSDDVRERERRRREYEKAVQAQVDSYAHPYGDDPRLTIAAIVAERRSHTPDHDEATPNVIDLVHTGVEGVADADTDKTAGTAGQVLDFTKADQPAQRRRSIGWDAFHTAKER
jgi:transposase InsO family protein